MIERRPIIRQYSFAYRAGLFCKPPSPYVPQGKLLINALSPRFYDAHETLCASFRGLLYSADDRYQSLSILSAIPPRLVRGVGTTGNVTTAKLINKLGDLCLHLPNIPDMVYKLALAFLWSAQAVSSSYVKYPCTNPVVRREWRAITTEERAEWIRAINVRIDTPHVDHLAEAYSESSACRNSLMTRL